MQKATTTTFIFCPTCRNMLRPSVDAEDTQLYYRCSACSYKHFAEKDECLVRFREVKPPSNYLKETLETIKSDPALTRCIIDCMTCQTRTVAVEIHERIPTQMNLIYVCEECKMIQRPSRLIKAMISNKDVFESMENMNENNLEQETDLVSQDQEENTSGWDDNYAFVRRNEQQYLTRVLSKLDKALQTFDHGFLYVASYDDVLFRK
ncbi:DNA-directed RNA polymerase II subunit RPB9 [Gigaspora margarita]|uniref:DNA-directed RNA polymerase II subunit RPB9 n=1 Tax=Gigaspora margarita TaxID=4874 RepID=A0A8H3X0S4_GIGMA|nr:DNA-directed RNA polymerase II subunit RPB9 [Gigaspora margarita]